MKKMSKYPSIGQFRNLVKTVRDTVKFKGIDEDGNVEYYDDENIVFPTIRDS